MKKILISLALGLSGACLWAQGVESMSTQIAVPEPTPRSVGYLLGLGYANGGDTVTTVAFTNGTFTPITAGSGIYLKVGADWRVLSNFSLQGNLGYHTNYVKGANGDVSFDRTFVEGLGFWHFLPAHRIGLGVRQVSNLKLRGSGAASSLGTVEFSASPGTVLEYEWMISRSGARGFGITFRYVTEKYTPTSDNGTPVSGPEFNANHTAIALHMYF